MPLIEQDDRSVDAGHGISFGEALRVWLRVALLELRRARRPDRGDASHPGRGKELDLREPVPACAELLHAAAGPEAQQLATYIGWLLHRTAGGIMAGGLFILPGIIAIMGLSYIYAAYGNVGFIEALFFGLKAAVLAIVIQAVVRVGKRALRNRIMIALARNRLRRDLLFQRPLPDHHHRRRRDRLFRRAKRPAGICRGRARRRRQEAAVVDSLLGEELPDHVRPSVRRALKVSAIWLAAVAGAGGSAPDRARRRPTCSARSRCSSRKMAMVTFGGAYAVLAYVAQQAVEHYHWLQPREMLDGLGMAETTPGPLIMVLQFVGFMAAYRDPGTLSPMLAATLGGLLATWVTLHALLPLDLPRRALHRDPARQQGTRRRADGDHRRRGRRDPQSVDLVRAAHRCSGRPRRSARSGCRSTCPCWSSIDIAAFVLAVAAATAIFRLNIGMLWVLAGLLRGVALRCGDELERVCNS